MEQKEKARGILDVEYPGGDSKRKKQKNKLHPLKEYIWKGLTIFLVVASCIIFGVIVLRFDEVLAVIRNVLAVMEPILCGLVFAYLLNPVMNKVEQVIYRYFFKDREITPKIKSAVRGFSIFITIMFALIIIIVLLAMVIPELFVSIGNLIKDLPEQFHSFNLWVSNLSVNEKFDNIIGDMMEQAGEGIEKWIKSDLIKQTNVFVSKLTVGVFGVFNFFKVFFVGIIVSIYVLANKEKFMGQSKKLLYALFSESAANTTMDLLRDSHRIFINFVTGKVIDSFIIGILCFLGLTVLKMPYTLIVSVVVGVTNVIPFFGPYLGAIPSAILIALVSPKSSFIFLVFILVLQQLDGNLLGPKILGESIGLSAFWVIFAIIVGSGLFGFPGMVFGVPAFAVIYHIICELVDKRLEEKKLPTNTSLYHKMDHISNSKLIIHQEEEKKEVEEKEKE